MVNQSTFKMLASMGGKGSSDTQKLANSEGFEPEAHLDAPRLTPEQVLSQILGPSSTKDLTPTT